MSQMKLHDQSDRSTQKSIPIDWSYAEAPENTSHATFLKSYGLFINGSFTNYDESQSFNSINPANGEVLYRCTEASEIDVDIAVKAARASFEGEWGNFSGTQRSHYLYRIARMLQERAREFAVLESMDGGKPIRESRDIDIPLAAAYFFYYAGWADKLPYAFPGKSSKPLGVCAQIIPWNFPLLMLAWKIAPALACGNTVVLKPAETTSLTALKFCELLQDIGLPNGVVNIVTGAGKTGEYLVQHPDIDKIAFTGSTGVGKLIQQSIAKRQISATFELGGKGAFILFDDAALNEAVEGIINAIFFNQGHVCCAGSRLLVQEGVAEKVIDLLKNRMQHLIIGDPLDKNTDIGAVNSKTQLETIQRYVATGIKEGASCYECSGSLPNSGYYFPPTLLTGVSQSSTVVQEEIFGPILTIQTFRTTDEAIEKANNTPYGLANGIWTDKGSKIFYVGSKLKSGVVWSNTYNKFDPTSPFGGYKESGKGREGGISGLHAYVKLVNNGGMN
ncbi:MAG: betaine-aldehyde dehydrogenase [Balneola sp.]|nr:betaine-aldehyde dehydrogenase [Balneola sp.]|tara:strand:- start:1853 stop:3364 length:1512 start_codon:yes stop_codon:yes gene_type:complete